MPEVIYSSTLVLYQNSTSETNIWEETTSGGQYLTVFNNTQMNLIVLCFPDASGAKPPTQFPVSAGKGGAFGAKCERFAIWAESVTSGSAVIPPAGAGGEYAGPGHATANAVGSITISAYDEPFSPNLSGNGAVTGQVVTVQTQNAGLALDGTDQTGVVPPTGATGIRGWLSALYKLFQAGTAQVSINPATEPLPTNPATPLQASHTYTANQTDQTIVTAGFVSLSATVDDPSLSIILAIDESSTTGTVKPITIKAGESFKEGIKGTVIHYSAPSGSPAFRLLAR